MLKSVGRISVVVALLAAPAFSSPAAEIREYFDRTMYRTGEIRLEAFLEKEPDSPAALTLLAELRMVEEDWEGAEAAARRAVTIDAKNIPGWMLWARARFEQGRVASRGEESADFTRKLFEQAETGFKRVQQIQPDHPDVLWWIGWSRQWQGRYGVAEQFFEAQIREFPEHPGGYRRLAQLRIKMKEPEKALAAFDLGLEKAGEDAETLYLRALFLDDRGEKEKAVESLTRSVLADPDFVRSWNQLRTRVDEATVLAPLAIRALETHPTSAIAARWAGYHTLRREPLPREKERTRYELTLGYVLPALMVHADDEELFKIAFKAAAPLIGATPKKAPNARLAVDAFKRIHEAYQWSGDAANNLGFYYREVRKYRESLAWYLKSCERSPENQDILNDTGLMYLFHFPRKKAEGLPYFLKTVRLVRNGDQRPDRGYWDALENLCKHYWEVDRQPEKVVMYARLRYLTTKGVKPYNMSRVSARYAEKAKKALGR